MQILTNGNVGIGTTTPGSALTVSGNTFITGNATTTNLTATGTLNVSGTTTLASSLNGLLFSVNGLVSSLATSSITNLSNLATVGTLTSGSRVNLERPTAAGSPLGGHIVQGHVDDTGILTALDPVIPETDAVFDRTTTDWTLKVKVPERVSPWMVHKGSVAIEGISLTIADFDGETISIAILPLTYWRTNLHTLSVGAQVNVEADVLVKLAYSRMEAEKTAKRPPEFDLTEAWLVANGY